MTNTYQTEMKFNQQIASELGKIQSFERVSGGDINQAAKIRVKERDYFVKWHEGEYYPGMFQAEATGLEILARTKTIRVPQVIMATNECLVLEWLELARQKLDKSALQQLGRQLARLHGHTSALFGLATNNFIGTLPQTNSQLGSWVDFFWGQRLKPQIEVARRRNKLSLELEDLLDRLYERLPDLIPDRPEASLLHGDLWGGNWAVLRSGEPVLFDPAVYCGHREMDLAMTELFGGFGKEFYGAYEVEWPTDPGYQDRKQLYQLYPLLVHLNLFGEGYEDQVKAVLKRYI